MLTTLIYGIFRIMIYAYGVLIVLIVCNKSELNGNSDFHAY